MNPTVPSTWPNAAHPGCPKACLTVQPPAEADGQADSVQLCTDGRQQIAKGGFFGRHPKGFAAAGGTGGFGELQIRRRVHEGWSKDGRRDAEQW